MAGSRLFDHDILLDKNFRKLSSDIKWLYVQLFTDSVSVAITSYDKTEIEEKYGEEALPTLAQRKLIIYDDGYYYLRSYFMQSGQSHKCKNMPRLYLKALVTHKDSLLGASLWEDLTTISPKYKGIEEFLEEFHKIYPRIEANFCQLLGIPPPAVGTVLPAVTVITAPKKPSLPKPNPVPLEQQPNKLELMAREAEERSNLPKSLDENAESFLLALKNEGFKVEYNNPLSQLLITCETCDQPFWDLAIENVSTLIPEDVLEALRENEELLIEYFTKKR